MRVLLVEDEEDLARQLRESLEDAVQKFGDSAKAAVADAMERLEELRREAASSIIVPGAGGAGVPPGAGGGAPGGGGIQLP